MPRRPKDLKPEQQHKRPGREAAMEQKPAYSKPSHIGTGKLEHKVAIITGGDSGIGRAVAVAFAREGADVVIAYLQEHEDALKTRRLVEAEGRRCSPIAGDVGNEGFCQSLVEDAMVEFGHLDIIVNNAAEQHPQNKLQDISAQQLERTFRTNVFSMFYLTKAALPHLKGGVVINTTSVTAYRGSPHLLDYSATKGAIVSFTRSLALALAPNIRVNAVAPGPVWTPLIPSTFPKRKVDTFGQDVPLGRPGQPEEIAPAFVFLASDDASYMTGQVIHPNGGEIING